MRDGHRAMYSTSSHTSCLNLFGIKHTSQAPCRLAVKRSAKRVHTFVPALKVPLPCRPAVLACPWPEQAATRARTNAWTEGSIYRLERPLERDSCRTAAPETGKPKSRTSKAFGHLTSRPAVSVSSSALPWAIGGALSVLETVKAVRRGDCLLAV